jgi:hypothetical protein
MVVLEGWELGGTMAQYDVWELDIAVTVADHIGHRDIAPEDIRSLIDGDYLVRRNRSGRTASHLLLGTDRRGRCLAVPILATNVLGVWRAITAWPCKNVERLTLRRYLGRR